MRSRQGLPGMVFRPLLASQPRRDKSQLQVTDVMGAWCCRWVLFRHRVRLCDTPGAEADQKGGPQSSRTARPQPCHGLPRLLHSPNRYTLTRCCRLCRHNPELLQWAVQTAFLLVCDKAGGNSRHSRLQSSQCQAEFRHIPSASSKAEHSKSAMEDASPKIQAVAHHDSAAKLSTSLDVSA